MFLTSFELSWICSVAYTCATFTYRHSRKHVCRTAFFLFFLMAAQIDGKQGGKKGATGLELTTIPGPHPIMLQAKVRLLGVSP